MAFSNARYRWRAKLDFYAASGVVLPAVHPWTDEDWAAMQRPASPAEQAARPNGGTGAPKPSRPTPMTIPAPDVSPARLSEATFDL